MRIYWDSTALLNALAAQPVVDRLAKGQHFTRSHAFVETFHHLSGKGLPRKDGTRLAFSPGDGANMIRRLAKQLEVRDLDKEETLTALDNAQKRGVSGRMVHDWLHIRAAKLGGATLILTRDEPMDKLTQTEGIPTDWP